MALGLAKKFGAAGRGSGGVPQFYLLGRVGGTKKGHAGKKEERGAGRDTRGGAMHAATSISCAAAFTNTQTDTNT